MDLRLLDASAVSAAGIGPKSATAAAMSAVLPSMIVSP
jgi:hypothetical protein